MRRRTFTSLILTACALPVAALAYFTTPSSLLEALWMNGRPMDIAHEAHIFTKDLSMSGWLRGGVEGKDLAGAKSDLRLTVDVATDEGTLRIKTQMRLLNSTLYVMIDSIQGPDAEILGGYVDPKQWYGIPLEEQKDTYVEQSGVSEEDMKKLLWDVVDAMLALKRTAEGEGSLYLLSLKRNAWKDIQSVVKEFAAEHPDAPFTPSNRDLTELRKYLRTLRLSSKIWTDATDAPTGTKFYVSASDKTFHAVVQGTSTVRTTPITVAVPTNVKSIEDIIDSSSPEATKPVRPSRKN